MYDKSVNGERCMLHAEEESPRKIEYRQRWKWIEK